MESLQGNMPLNRYIRTAVVLSLLAASSEVYADGALCQTIASSCQTAAFSAYEECMAGGGDGQPCDQVFASQMGACSASCTEMFAWPQSKLISILYVPPGNKSTVGYSSSTTNGTTDSYTSTFDTSNTVQLSSSLKGSDDGVSFGFTGGGSFGSETSGSVTNTETSSVQNTQGTTVSSSEDIIDHTQDLLTIWTNPQITVANFGGSTLVYPTVGYGNTNLVYSLGNSVYNPTSASSGSVVNGDAAVTDDMSTVSATVAQLQNPTALLVGQLVHQVKPDGTLVAGLLSMCAQRVAESACTQAAASATGCGCTAADFSSIVQQDPFFNPGIADHSIAGINAADPNGERFAPVVSPAGGDETLLLASGQTSTATVTDTNTTSVTLTYKSTVTDSMSIGFSLGYGSSASFGITDSDKDTLTQEESTGSSNGTTHTQQVSLATSSAGCYENLNVYEDTVFHTFVFDSGSGASDPCP